AAPTRRAGSGCNASSVIRPAAAAALRPARDTSQTPARSILTSSPVGTPWDQGGVPLASPLRLRSDRDDQSARRVPPVPTAPIRRETEANRYVQTGLPASRLLVIPVTV